MASLMKYLSAWAPKQNRNMATLQEIFTKQAGIWDTRRVRSAVQGQFVQSLSALREPRLLGRWARQLPPRPGRSQQDTCFSLFIWTGKSHEVTFHRSKARWWLVTSCDLSISWQAAPEKREPGRKEFAPSKSKSHRRVNGPKVIPWYISVPRPPILLPHKPGQNRREMYGKQGLCQFLSSILTCTLNCTLVMYQLACSDVAGQELRDELQDRKSVV